MSAHHAGTRFHVLAVVCVLTLPVLTGTSVRGQGTAQANPASDRMPRAGIDPGGVVTGIATRLPMKDVSTLRLRFEAGARTIWHVHVGPQLLLVEEGVARVQQKGGAIVDLKPGQSIYLPPNVAHWHGAAPNAAVVMLSLYPIGSKLDPGAEVTEQEYQGKGSNR
jgi:quercetin dioxygenase-like cupin family protein